MNIIFFTKKPAGRWKVLPPKDIEFWQYHCEEFMAVNWPILEDESAFHHFPLLPKELRLQIWEELLPEPRLIQFQVEKTEHLQ
jgi:hypothetical protein